MATHNQEPKTPARIEVEGPNGIVLKQLTVEDAQAYFDLIEYNRAHLSQFLDDTAQKYQTVEDVIKSIQLPENPEKLRFGIWENGVMVGSINLTPRPDKVAEVGYWIGGQHIGHGYAAKALEALDDYAFSHGYENLYASVYAGNEDFSVPGNEASKKTLLKNGYHLVNTNKHVNEDDSNVHWYWRFEKHFAQNT